MRKPTKIDTSYAATLEEVETAVQEFSAYSRAGDIHGLVIVAVTAGDLLRWRVKLVMPAISMGDVDRLISGLCQAKHILTMSQIEETRNAGS